MRLALAAGEASGDLLAGLLLAGLRRRWPTLQTLGIGGLSGVHQFCKVGAHVMTGFQSHVSQDVPPFMTVSGNPLSVHGFNVEGLRRRGFSRERLALVKQMHRLMYRDGLTLEAARPAIAALLGTVEGGDDDVRMLLDFLAASTRGIVR